MKTTPCSPAADSPKPSIPVTTSSRPQLVARGRLFFARHFQSSAPAGKHYASPILYPANFPALGGGLIFFCPLFFHQGKKRGKKEGRKRLSKSSPCRAVALVGFHFKNIRRSVALFRFHLESTCRSVALIKKHYARPIPYPANFPAPGGGLIFFCPLFFHQGKKRG